MPALHTCLSWATNDACGGRERIRSSDDGNYVTWKQVHAITGLGIIADTGYGIGGLSHGHDHRWDNMFNLRQRIADGVVAVTQASGARLCDVASSTTLHPYHAARCSCGGIFASACPLYIPGVTLCFDFGVTHMFPLGRAHVGLTSLTAT